MKMCRNSVSVKLPYFWQICKFSSLSPQLYYVHKWCVQALGNRILTTGEMKYFIQMVDSQVLQTWRVLKSDLPLASVSFSLSVMETGTTDCLNSAYGCLRHKAKTWFGHVGGKPDWEWGRNYLI